MTGPAGAERRTLCDLLERLGPDAPTLCEGWTTSHLAAHLVVREGRPDALPGLVLPGPAARWTGRLERRAQQQEGYADLLARLRAGPPLGVFGLPGFAEAGNVHEFFVHLEDVRRAQPGGAPRAPGELPPGLPDALWSRLRLLGPVLYRSVHGAAVSLRDAESGRVVTLGRRDPRATLTGAVPELFLYSYNRKSAAQVELSGPEAAVRAVRRARLGL